MKHKVRAALLAAMSCAMAGTVCLPPIQTVHAQAYQGPLLSMSHVVQIGVANDRDLADLQGKIEQQKLKVKEAEQVKRVKPNSLTRNLTVRLKAPEARVELQKIERDKRKKELDVRLEIEQMYGNAYLAQVHVRNVEQKREETAKMLSDLKAKARFGLVTADEVEAAEKLAAKAESEYKTAKLAQNAAKLELGSRVGLDLEPDYQFEVHPQYAVLNAGVMWQLIDAGLKQDVELFKATEDRKLAEGRVTTIQDVYRKKFGPATTRMIEGMYQTPKGVDYAKFMKDYNGMLRQIKKSWEGFFLFPAPFIIILPIPKFLLQGDYDGLRFFEDDRYMLPVAMMDRDKARLKEQDVRKKTIQNIKKSYLNAKQTEEGYRQTILLRDEARQAVRDGEAQVRFGKLGEEDLLALKEALRKAEEGVISGYVGYQAVISQLNAMSGGRLDGSYKAGELPLVIDDGLHPLKDPPNGTPDPTQAGGGDALGSWKVEAVAETVTSAFSVEASPQTAATHFALLTADGKQIGAVTPLNGKIVHLSFLFAKPDQLKVVLYQSGKPVAEAQLDGYGSAGVLKGKGE